MPLYHLVGALDPLTPAEVTKPVGDGLPEHLGEWIHRDGLTHLEDQAQRRRPGLGRRARRRGEPVAEQAQRDRGVTTWYYSLDFNEKCANVEYLLEFLRHASGVRTAGVRPRAIHRAADARDLKANPENKMHEAAKIKPVVIDESLDRSGEPAPRPRAGLHRRRAQGVQGADADTLCWRPRPRSTACSSACRI